MERTQQDGTTEREALIGNNVAILRPRRCLNALSNESDSDNRYQPLFKSGIAEYRDRENGGKMYNKHPRASQ